MSYQLVSKKLTKERIVQLTRASGCPDSESPAENSVSRGCLAGLRDRLRDLRVLTRIVIS